MGHLDPKRYELAENFAKSFFEKNKKIKSPCLGDIFFNSDGFRHLIWKIDKIHKRDWKNQVKRFELLNYVKPVIEKMGFYQEYLETIEHVKIKDHGKIKIVSKKIIYWCFIAVIENKIRIKVILRKIGDGNIIFWSVIPYWKTTEYKDIKLVSLHKGNPCED